MKTKEFRTIQTIAHIVCGLFALLVLLPFILLIISSLTDNAWATSNGFSFSRRNGAWMPTATLLRSGIPSEKRIL